MGFFKLPIFHVYKEMIHLLTEKHQGTLPNGPKDAYMSRVYVHMLISVCVYVNLIMYLNYVSQKKNVDNSWREHILLPLYPKLQHLHYNLGTYPRLRKEF